MPVSRLFFASLVLGLAAALSGCTSNMNAITHFAPIPITAPPPNPAAPPLTASASPQRAAIDGLIAKYSGIYNVPESLIRRVIVRESGYNPKARNGPYYGLMQIRYDTAQSMGYRGPASGLLEADINLRYGVKYLSGAYMVGKGNPDQAVRFYSRGYYYDAKRMGLLDEIGL